MFICGFIVVSIHSCILALPRFAITSLFNRVKQIGAVKGTEDIENMDFQDRFRLDNSVLHGLWLVVAPGITM